MNDQDTVMIRLAKLDDLEFVRQGHELSLDMISRKLSQGEIILVNVNDQPVGSLWFAFLWSTIPFIDLIYLQEAYRKRGLSRFLLGWLEDHLRERGYAVLYSSSQLDEPIPQAWHRHMGFEECGVISGLNAGGVGEVFFRKML